MSEELDLLQKKVDYLQHRNALMNHIVANEAARASESEEGVDANDVAERIFIDAVERGVELGVFRPDGALELPDDLPNELRMAFTSSWEEAIPWGVVKVVAGEFGIDAEEFDAKFEMVGSGPSMPVAQLSDIAQALGDDVWSRKTKGMFILECAHDGHACEHSFSNLQIAIDTAIEEMTSGKLEAIGQIRRDGVVVVSAEDMRSRLEIAQAARYN